MRKAEAEVMRTHCMDRRRSAAAAALELSVSRSDSAGSAAKWRGEAARCSIPDIEHGYLGCVRRVLQAEGWPARSWQQDGLLVEDEGGRQLRGGGGGDEAKARLEAAMRKAEAEVGRTQDMEVSLLAKSFFEAPVWRPCCSGWPVPAAGGPR